jgi:hypothetical protein
MFKRFGAPLALSCLLLVNAKAAKADNTVLTIAYYGYYNAASAYSDAYTNLQHGGSFATYQYSYFAYFYSYLGFYYYNSAGNDNGYFTYASEYAFFATLSAYADYADLGTALAFDTLVHAYYAYYYEYAAATLELDNP